MATNSTQRPSHIHVAFKVAQLVGRLRSHLKPRAQSTKPKNDPLDPLFYRDLARATSKGIDSCHFRKGDSSRSRRIRKTQYRVSKTRPEEGCEWQDKCAQPTRANRPNHAVAALSRNVDDLGYTNGSLCRVAADDNLFVQRKTEPKFVHLTWLRTTHALATVNEFLQVIQDLLDEAPSRDGCKPSCHGKELGFLDAPDEKALANLEHLLRCILNTLAQALTHKSYVTVLKDALHERNLGRGQRKLGGCVWCSEFAGNHRPISTTWPWSIRPSLAVLWGVCWMFHPGESPGVAYQDLLDNPGLAEWLGWLHPQSDDYLVHGRRASAVPNAGAQPHAHDFHVQARPRPGLVRESQPSGAVLAQGHHHGPRGFDGRAASDEGQYNGDASLADAWSPTTGSPDITAEWRPGNRGSIATRLDSEHAFDWNNFSQPQQQQQQQEQPEQPNSVPTILVTRPRSPLRCGDGHTEAGRVSAAGEGFAAPHCEYVGNAHDTTPSAHELYALDSAFPQSCNFPAVHGAMGVQEHSRSLSRESSVSGRRPSESESSKTTVMSEEESVPDVPVGRSNTYKRPADPPKDESGRLICERSECSHLTFTRKCEWGKHMDKHERPYKCRATGCEKLPGFTYSGGLLRHQREVHKIGASSKKPLFCDFPGCKRGPGGEGFTRKENLAEHKRRVHQQPSTDASSPVTKGKDEEAEAQTPAAQEEENATEALQEWRTPTKRKRSSGWTGVNDGEQEGHVRDEVKRLRKENEDLRRGMQDKDERLRKLEGRLEDVCEELKRLR